MKKCKNLFILLLVAVVLIGNIAMPLEEYVAEIEEQQVEIELEEYFSQRKEEFCGIRTNNSRFFNEESERAELIQTWKDELDIEVEDVEIEYNICEIIADTESDLQLLVYEWVWVDYQCSGFDKIETMGFGTDHLLTFVKENGEMNLTSDIYSEITGYETGTQEQLAVLRAEVASADELEMLQNEEMITENESVVAAASYSASSAVSYSNKWCGNSNAGTSVSMTPAKYNPSYYYIPGADCCNFVSQCLVAGGMTMGGVWSATLNTSGTVTSDSACVKSKIAWRYVPEFETYWKGKGYNVTRITSTKQAVIGNSIYYLASDGYSSNHIMLIVGTNSAGQVLINGHNNDAYRYPLTLSSKKYYTLDLIHSYKNVISYNSSTHTLQCVNCSKKQTNSHVFVSIYSTKATRQCNVCGYTE